MELWVIHSSICMRRPYAAYEERETSPWKRKRMLIFLLRVKELFLFSMSVLLSASLHTDPSQTSGKDSTDKHFDSRSLTHTQHPLLTLSLKPRHMPPIFVVDISASSLLSGSLYDVFFPSSAMRQRTQSISPCLLSYQKLSLLSNQISLTQLRPLVDLIFQCTTDAHLRRPLLLVNCSPIPRTMPPPLSTVPRHVTWDSVSKMERWEKTSPSLLKQ